MKLYEEVAYARTRLIESIVRRGNDPIMVNNIDRNTVFYTDLETEEAGTCKYKELNITPVSLGYCNYNGEAYYVRRIPARRYKQGLTAGAISTSAHGERMNIAFPLRALVHTIKGLYPNVLKVQIGSEAFSRDFARDTKDNLFYKGNWKVGSLSRDGRYELLPDFAFLREQLLETLEAKNAIG